MTGQEKPERILSRYYELTKLGEEANDRVADRPAPDPLEFQEQRPRPSTAPPVQVSKTSGSRTAGTAGGTAHASLPFANPFRVFFSALRIVAARPGPLIVLGILFVLVLGF